MAGRSSLLAAKYMPGAAAPTPAPQNAGAPYHGLISPLATQLANERGYSNTYGPFLPRPAETFTEGAFGPFSPILPVPVDAPAEPEGLPDPRLFEYRVGWNLPVGQPGTEGLKLADFGTLRTLADLYSVARACIEKRKNEIIGLDWDIVPTHEATKAYQGDRKAMRDFGERRAKAVKFFRHPDPDYFSFGEFMSALLEMVFVYDALSIVLRPKRGKGMGKGLLGSDLDCLELIDGSTIRPLLGMHGEIPRPPAPAYQQYLYGVPRSDYMTMITQRDIDEGGLAGSEIQSFTTDQLLYLRTTPRRWTPYGFANLEQVLIPVLTGLQKQAWQLDYFREGTVPGIYISPGDPNMTPNQIRELQDALNAIAGDPAWHHKVIVLPPGSKTEPQRPVDLADQFDEIVMTEVCQGFDINPMDLGIIPKVSTAVSPFAAREMAQASRAVHERTATKPLLKFLCNIFDAILHRVCGQDDMKFTFEGLTETQNEAAMTDLIVKQVQYGIRSVDEGRAELELPPWNLPETSGPVVFTQMGPVSFEDAQALLAAQAQPQQGSDTSRNGPKKATSTTGRGDQYGGPGRPRHSTPVPAMGGGKPTSGEVPPQRKPTPAHDAARAGMNVTSHAAAKSELESLARWLKKGREISTWETRHIPAVTLALISEDLAKGLTVDQAVDVAMTKTLGGDALPKVTQWPGWQRDLGLVGAYTEIIRHAFAHAEGEDGRLREEQGRGVIAVTPAQFRDMTGQILQEAISGALAPMIRDAWKLGYESARTLTGTHADETPGVLEAFLATELRHWAEQIGRTGLQNASQRAELIARTEIARTQAAAALQCYRDAGVAYKHLLVAPEDACPECRNDEADGDIPLDAAFSSGNLGPPVHPACRCAIAPAGIEVVPPLAHLGKNDKQEPVAFLLIRARNGDGKWRYLLQKRGDDVKNPDTWGLPGGTAHPDEDPWATALRESAEEMGALPRLAPSQVLCDDHDDRQRIIFVCETDMFEPTVDGSTPHEVAGWGWFSPGEIKDLDLHPGFKRTWEDFRAEKRKRVLVSGQEIYPDPDDEDDADPPGGGGARYPHPHRADGTEVFALGGRPGTEPPRWDGDETEPFVALPDGPAGAYGVREGRAGTPPAGGTSTRLRDGSRKKPRAIVAPPDADDARWPLERGRPPNAVGKGASDYWDPNPVEPEHVLSLMRANFPEDKLSWVKRTHWIGPVQVPWDRIDDDDIDSWASSHQPDAVNRFAREIKAGRGHLNPSILVQRPDAERAIIVDGHHRALARRKLGKPVLAYVGFAHAGKDMQDALETHSSQLHSGSDPKNR